MSLSGLVGFIGTDTGKHRSKQQIPGVPGLPTQQPVCPTDQSFTPTSVGLILRQKQIITNAPPSSAAVSALLWDLNVQQEPLQ